jgi:hypothetical protein
MFILQYFQQLGLNFLQIFVNRFVVVSIICIGATSRHSKVD